MNSLELTLEAARPFLKQITYDAGEVVMKHFRQAHQTQNKVGNDIVTEADFESESLVANAIRAQFPEHSLVAEEGSQGAVDSEFCWYIDPLDGTVNYAAGIPIFAVSISLAYKNEPVLAAILDPTRNELYWAEKGKGTTCNGEPIHVSETRELSNAVVYVSEFGLRKPELADSLLTTLKRLGPATRNLINQGSAGLAWAYVAAGYVDVDLAFAVDQYTGPAGILLVREAGGRVTDFSGKDWTPGTTTAAATNGHLHDATLALIERPAV